MVDGFYSSREFGCMFMSVLLSSYCIHCARVISHHSVKPLSLAKSV